MIEQILDIIHAVDTLTEIEGQDRSMVLDMSQAMLTDLAETGSLRIMEEYAARYVDVADGPEDLTRIAQEMQR